MWRELAFRSPECTSCSCSLARRVQPGQLERSADTISGLLERQPLRGLLGLGAGLQPKQFGLLEFGDRLERVQSDPFGVQFVEYAVQCESAYGPGCSMPFQLLSVVAAARFARAASISCSRSIWARSASGMRPSSQPSSVTSVGVAPAGIGYLPARSCSTAACATTSCFSSSARRSAGERSWTAALSTLALCPSIFCNGDAASEEPAGSARASKKAAAQ